LFKTHGIDEANSAIDRATVITKKQGINHPHTIPTWPPASCQCKNPWNSVKNVPEARENEKIEVTAAPAPKIENAKAMVSII